LQQVDGYDATIVSGVVTQRGGAATGARPGRLLRGAQGSLHSIDAAAS
jgi:N-acyl-D-aspartate/D-glutamate deacylase